MSTAQEIRAAIASADEEMADALRRLSDHLTNGDLESAKIVAAQAGAAHAKLVRLHREEVARTAAEGVALRADDGGGEDGPAERG